MNLILNMMLFTILIESMLKGYLTRFIFTILVANKVETFAQYTCSEYLRQFIRKGILMNSVFDRKPEGNVTEPLLYNSDLKIQVNLLFHFVNGEVDRPMHVHLHFVAKENLIFPYRLKSRGWTFVCCKRRTRKELILLYVYWIMFR